ncbi:hypothetical protein AVEN_252972-1 [Araneus ventricosus]|uniref:Uncharacterized protein n=1 Tax=Araneus ventricosus TaxID=182803 RepID=A0A4Y2T464_ARAVE|nr:hypothetical protein AVEN_252972-1 [Araneus ventricosus]
MASVTGTWGGVLSTFGSHVHIPAGSVARTGIEEQGGQDENVLKFWSPMSIPTDSVAVLASGKGTWGDVLNGVPANPFNQIPIYNNGISHEGR